jgi:hypothetical protein
MIPQGQGDFGVDHTLSAMAERKREAREEFYRANAWLRQARARLADAYGLPERIAALGEVAEAAEAVREAAIVYQDALATYLQLLPVGTN